MKVYICCLLFGIVAGQFHQPPSGSSPWSSSPLRPSGSSGGPPKNRPTFSYNKAPQQPSYDDPIPPSQFESYDTQTLPSKLPIQAPNGVIEIYNRVIDDLIKRLENDFKKRNLDPMDVIIRPTPPGPVRVPGHLQKRPFRRPGAALYRNAAQPLATAKPNRKAREGRFVNRPEVEKPSFRGSGKISKGTLEDIGETTTEIIEQKPSSNKSEEVSSEELDFLARSDEFFPDEDDVEDERNGRKDKKNKDDTEEEEDDEDTLNPKPSEPKVESKDVTTLVEKYNNKNTNPVTNAKEKTKYSGGNKKKPTSAPPPAAKKQPINTDEDEEEDDEMQNDEPDFDLEPGTGQSGGDRPNGGYYPNSGAPAIPPKPNAKLIGLSRMKRSSDVAVSVDARSAVITARLLVGPLDVTINDSIEPQEKNIKATIPELEAELLLMERHGVVFLQRFTLDRAYGQDIEISIPKVKKSDKGKKGSNNNSGPPQQTGGFPINHPDPNHPSNVQQRFQTKMAAHISMEIVKLLRSGNLRVNLMRVAQGSMSKLKLPIVKVKKENKGKGGEGKGASGSSGGSKGKKGSNSDKKDKD